MAPEVLRNVAGTAFWIAHQRAEEAKRTSPLLRDPWAAELAGERGAQIDRQLGRASRYAWANITRAWIFDQLLSEGLDAHGFDTVINLGAGLDTRAFRLSLPASLRWVDIDKPEIIEYRSTVLSGAEARCEYRAVAADLSIDATRKKTLHAAAADARKALVISEGVLEYLSPDAVHTLALELHALPPIHTWLLNMLLPEAVAGFRRFAKMLARVNAPLLFLPRDGTEFFRRSGWREAAWVSTLERASHLGRTPFPIRSVVTVLRYLSPRLSRRLLRGAGVARLERAE